MDDRDIQLEVLKRKMRGQNDPSLQDYVKTTSAEVLPFGDTVTGVVGGAGASLGRFVGGLQEGEGLSKAYQEGKNAFSEGRAESMQGLEDSRDKVPEQFQNALLAGSMITPGGITKAGKMGKLANLVDKGNDKANAVIAAARAKRMGKFANLENIMQQGKVNKLAKSGLMKDPGIAERIRKSSSLVEKIKALKPDIEPEDLRIAIQQAKARGII